MKPTSVLAQLLHPTWESVTRLDNYSLQEVPGGFMNLTSYAVSNQMAAVLSFGPRFLMPRRFGALDILNDLGALHTYLEVKYGNLDPTQVFVELFRCHRQELVTLFLGQSLSMAETCVLDACTEVYEFFQVYKDACIIQADKGNRTCLMLKQDYVSKMRAYVANSVSKGVYIEVKEKAQYVANKAFLRLRIDILSYVRSMDDCKLPQDLVDNLIRFNASNAVLPHLYGVVKSHKEGSPMRPICSTVGWYARPIQKILLYILKNAFSTMLCKQNITNVDEMVRDLHSMRQRAGYVYVKFDVTDMYGSMNKTKIASVLHDLLVHPSVQANLPLSVGLVERLFHYSMDTSCLVSFDEHIYRQVRGLPQGACDSGYLATLYLDSLLQIHSEELFEVHHVKKWYKYMDDLLLYMPRKYIESFKETFEKITDLKLEVEYEDVADGGNVGVYGVTHGISFLDVQINRVQDGSVLVSRYTKPTASKRMIHALSSTLQTYKLNTIRGFILKILRRTSTSLLVKDLNAFYEQALFNGYPPALLDNLYFELISREIGNLKSGSNYLFLSLSRTQTKERVDVLEAVLPDFPKGGPELIEDIRSQHVAVSVGSRCVFPYRSVALSHLIRLGCAYGGMSMPVYSRVDNAGAFSRFFGNRALGRLSSSMEVERRRFNVGLVWCTTCKVVFVVSGRLSLDRLFESEMGRPNSVLYRHKETYGHHISPKVRALRAIKGVDAAYMNTIYSVIFSSIGLSCSSPALLSRVPYFIRGLLGYMQGYGNFSDTPRLLSPEVDLFMNEGLGAILQDRPMSNGAAVICGEDLSNVGVSEPVEPEVVPEYNVLSMERTNLPGLDSASCNSQVLLELGECPQGVVSSEQDGPDLVQVESSVISQEVISFVFGNSAEDPFSDPIHLESMPPIVLSISSAATMDDISLLDEDGV